MSIELNGTTGIDFNDGSNQSTSATPYGRKNLIINGDMRIDQRNAGASVSTTGAYPVDRFFVSQNSSATWSAQQSSTAPDGFTKSLAFTQTTGQSVSAGNITSINHRIEGFNIANLGWGTANAQTVTLSFWVRSSLTGAFGVSFINGGYNRSYVASYTINSANTWEYKTVTVAGDQTGTWATDNGRGLNIDWDLGVGTTFSNSAGSWSAGDYEGLTGGVKLAATTGATFNITGVQLEVGDAASDFEFMPYDMELQRCERYYRKYILGDGTGSEVGIIGFNNTTGEFQGFFHFRTEMRAKPAFDYDGALSSYRVSYAGGGSANPTLIQQVEQNTWGSAIRVYISGLTAGQASVFRAISVGTGAINYDAEL